MVLHSKDAVQQGTVEIRVTDAWIRLIRWCITDLPHGELKIRIVNSEPTELLESKRKIRFDKPDTIPSKIDFGVEQ